MTIRAVLCCTVAVLAACTGSSSTQPEPDMSPVVPPDMSLVPADLSMAPDLSAPLLTQCGNIPVLGSQGKATTASCLSCVAASCCTEGTTCGTDTDCAALRTCLSSCTASSCQTSCNTMYAAGRTRSDAFNTCRNSKCNPVCNDFTCIGKVVWPNPAQSSYSMKLYPVDFVTRKTIPNALVRVCPAGDANCTTPSAMGTTDATGMVTLNVPVVASGISGYLEISEPNYMTTLSFLGHTDKLSYWANGIIAPYIVSKAVFAQLIGAVGVTASPTRGHLGFLTEDCGGILSSGISVATSNADAQSIKAYSVAGVPSKTATQTDASGFGFIANVPSGAATVTSTRNGARMGSDDGVLFRAGSVTTINVAPTP